MLVVEQNSDAQMIKNETDNNIQDSSSSQDGEQVSNAQTTVWIMPGLSDSQNNIVGSCWD